MEHPKCIRASTRLEKALTLVARISMRLRHGTAAAVRTTSFECRGEEVRVERVSVERREATEAEIGEDEFIVPFMEEEVVVEKRPVVKEEEIHLRKEVVEDEEAVERDVRKEEVDIKDQTERGVRSSGGRR